MGSINYYFTAAQIVGISEILGTEGSFTEGLNVKRSGDPLKDNGSFQGIEGTAVTSVVQATSMSGGVVIGWVHEEANRKVVFHWPIVQEHYEEFIGRVVCNYFDLCEPLKDVATGEKAQEFSVRFDALTHTITMSGLHQYSRVELYTTLGVKLLERSVDTEDASFSASLPSGNYIVVARSAEKVVARPVIVWK